MRLRAAAGAAAIATIALASASASTSTLGRSLLSEANIRLVGGAAADGAGASVAGAGDVNGDAVADLLVGAPGVGDSGAAYVVFGSDLTKVDLGSIGSDGYEISGGLTFASTGTSVANAGDVNGDGVADAIVGAPQWSSPFGGSAYVVFGKATTTPVDLSALGSNGFRLQGPSNGVGASVAGAGDVNDDGKADVIVGAPDAVKPGAEGVNHGAAYVVFGKAGTATVDLSSLGSAGYRIDGASFGDQAGAAVSGAGDINGDGKDDVLVSTPGAPQPPATPAYTGKVYVVYGKSDGAAIDLSVLGTAGYEIDGPSGSAFMGGAVASAGDVNGDGTPDQLISGGYAGTAYVVYGQSDARVTIDLGSLDSHGYAINGLNAAPRNAVASLGDVNSDGVPDAIIGDSGASPNGDGSGTAYVVYLHEGTAPINLASLGSDGYRVDGGAAHDAAGFAVADAGDVNGDGADDPFVGVLNGDPESRAQGGEADVAFFRPPNDDFVEAEDLVGPVGGVAGTSAGATKQVGEPAHAGDPGGSSVWYRWLAPATGLVDFSTAGSGFDTLLAAYTGSAVNALTAVAGNDDDGGSPTSAISFHAVAGTTYSIAVDGAGGDRGRVELFWNLHPPNDDFAAAQAISGDHGTVSGTTVGATKEPAEPDHAHDPGGASVWYAWTAPASGTLTVDTCADATDFDTLLAVYTGADVGHLTAVASNDDAPACELGSRVGLTVSGGTTYRIAVDGFEGEWGDFVLAWSLAPLPPPPLQRPANTAVPTISGDPVAGNVLTAAPGTWTGTMPITYAYQWDSCDADGGSCVPLPGEASTTYHVLATDAGSTLRVVVTAKNAAGQASAISRESDVVTVPIRCVVPNLKGKTVAKARTALRLAHCSLGRVSSARSRRRRGVIVSQRPRAGAVRARGAKVNVVVSRGRRRR